ncbi:MAG: S41 family peptidase [Clostridium sp.]|nr:S41 family peptidase [Clostridium sp.]
MSEFQEGKENKKRKSKILKCLSIFGVILLIGGAFFCGNYITRFGVVFGKNGDIYADVFKNKAAVDKYKTLFEVRDDLITLYDGTMDDEAMLEAAIKGMVNSLGDPYTVYMNSKEYKDLMSSISGSFKGIGVYIAAKDNEVVVQSTIEGGPAEKAGIKSKDVIFSVDGEEIGGDTDKAVALMKGEEIKTLDLVILRGEEKLQMSVTRADVKTVCVNGEMLNDEIGYIRLTSFDENAYKDFHAKLEELKKQGMKALVFDLRSNGGGLLTQAAKIASEFIPKGKIITYTIDKYENREDVKSIGGSAQGMPLVVLTDGYTASASEIVTGALRDYKAATVVGTKTYGKGVVQVPFELKSGEGGLKVTISKYYTPNGENINKVGINPDYEIELNEDELKDEYTKEKDSQINKALEILNEKLK